MKVFLGGLLLKLVVAQSCLFLCIVFVAICNVRYLFLVGYDKFIIKNNHFIKVLLAEHRHSTNWGD